MRVLCTLNRIYREQPSDAGVAPSTSTPEPPSSITSHLHNDLSALRNLREGFIVRHGSEPSVSFRFGHQSTSNSTISLRVGDETTSTTTVPSTSDNFADQEMVINFLIGKQFYLSLMSLDI